MTGTPGNRTGTKLSSGSLNRWRCRLVAVLLCFVPVSLFAEPYRLTDEETETLVYLFEQNEIIAVRQYLEERPEILYGSSRSANNSLLHLAVAHAPTIELPRFFLEAGLFLDGENDWKMTPLHFGIFHGACSDVILRLLEMGARIDTRDNEGDTPFAQTLISKSDPKVVQAFLELGPDIRQSNDAGLKPLHHATHGKVSLDIVRLLLDHGAEVDAETKFKITPLHFAARYADDVGVVALLLDRGADKNHADEDGRTPLHWVRWNTGDAFDPVFRLLVEKGADHWCPIISRTVSVG